MTTSPPWKDATYTYRARGRAPHERRADRGVDVVVRRGRAEDVVEAEALREGGDETRRHVVVMVVVLCVVRHRLPAR